ncbi:hypothetical protein LXA43DRAFT_1104103 [Ganoderma leucocontextum]|nr:hypothetical protein LXA43DRAFT_1104103 [Ganoderma leucocontextum]
MNPNAQDVQELRREQRKARNRRYQQKKKQRERQIEQLQDAPVLAGFSMFGGRVDHIVLSSPLSLPVSPPDTARIEQLALLNCSLQRWGFRDNPREFHSDLALEHARAALDKVGLETWKATRVAWVEEGDVILNEIEAFVCGGYLDNFTPEGLHNIWGWVTSVVYKIQYMIAAVEVHLDM